MIELLLLSVGACLNGSFVSFEGGANGSQVSLLALTNSSLGFSAGWSISNPSNTIYFTNYAQQAVGQWNLCSGGVVKDVNGILGLALMPDGQDDEFVKLVATTNPAVASCGAWIRTDLVPISTGNVDGGTQHDFHLLHAQTDYINFYFFNSPAVIAPYIAGGMECASGQNVSHTLDVVLTNSLTSWYWLTQKIDGTSGGTNYESVYSPDQAHVGGTPLGSWNCTNAAPDTLKNIVIKFQANHLTNGSPYHIWIDGEIVSYTGDYPLFPDSISTATINGATLSGFSKQ